MASHFTRTGTGLASILRPGIYPMERFRKLRGDGSGSEHLTLHRMLREREYDRFLHLNKTILERSWSAAP